MSASYTPGEKARIAWLLARGVKQAAAAGRDGDQDTVDPKFAREIDRITARGQDRYARQAAVMRAELEQANTAVARARTRLRIADRKDKPAARQSLKDAERVLNRVQRAARRYGT